MRLKQQTAIEFISTYSMALLILVLFVTSVLVLSDFRNPQTYLGSTCNIQPLLPCSQTLLTFNSQAPSTLQYYVVFSNQLGTVLYFPPTNSINVTTVNLGVSGTQYSLGSCNPSFASQGATVICEAIINGKLKPSTGTQTSLIFTLSYNICAPTKTNSNALKSCGIGLYKSTGSSSQVMAPSTVNLYNVAFNTVLNGTIVLNGFTYLNNTNAYLISGNYVIYGSPATGHHFGFWTIVASNSQIANTMVQNTILTLNSNAVITANFV